jgi:ABC-type amino acid transport substrate-binding protein
MLKFLSYYLDIKIFREDIEMKKLTAAILALAMCLGLCACGTAASTASTTASAAPANRLEEIKARGYIEVATEPYFVPFEFIDSSKTGDDQYVGVDMEIAKYIASELGVELRIVPLEFSAVLAGITSGKYDLAISALAYSPAREENMNMSEGYYFEEDSGGYGFLVRSADAGKYTSLDSLKDAVVVTQSGSVQESLVNDQVKAYKEFKRVSSMTDGFLMVGENKADVCVCDVQNGQLYADANPGYSLTVTDFRFTVDKSMEGTRIGIPKDETELTDFVNQCIEKLNTDGKITGWYTQYSEYAKSLGIQ